jgi:3-phenylpropionate/trans-cinnamate dioxygenase ferredoxin subunit
VARYVVARSDEVPAGGRKIVDVAGRSIGIFRVGNELFAVRNRCPHQGGPLCDGRLSGFLVGDGPGQYRYSRAGEVVRCPWHGWEFDLRTGESWFDPATTRVRTYDVAVVAGSQLARGPFTAETYAVTVEDDYVTVDVPG